MKKIVSVILSVMLVSGSSFALTPKAEKWVITIESDALEWQSPTWFEPVALENASEDIEYWTSILPYKEDRNDDMYIVLPTLWLITPVVFVPEGSEDYKNMTTWKEIDINKYLPEWVMHYPGTWMPWEVANPVIFGHSNYFAKEEGKYKSIFADLMNLDVSPRDEMWVFTKEDDEYELRKFTIEESYETTPDDVWILKPKGGKELTVFACTEWLKWRWILRGKMIENNEVLVPYLYKYRMSDILSDLADSPKRQSIIIEWMKKIKDAREDIPTSWLTYDDKMKKYVINWIERELVKLY